MVDKLKNGWKENQLCLNKNKNGIVIYYFKRVTAHV